jgi:prepilin-type processing-associated H-X9-DG protein
MNPGLFHLRRRTRIAFTIVELLVVIAIMALLAGVAMPAFQTAILRAQSSKCGENPHGIGIAVLQDVTDNNGYFPEIDQAATNVYQPAGSVQGLVGTLGKYGLMTNGIQCPTDMSRGSASSFQLYQSSYEWNPVLDDGTDPTTSISLGPIQVNVNSSRIRLCTDFVRLHRNKMNALYGDGHVVSR